MAWIARAIIVVVKTPITARVQIESRRWLVFRDPVLILQSDSSESVSRTLVDVEQLTRDRGWHAVGFVTFEAAAAFGLPASERDPVWPLAWFALFEPSGVTSSGPPVAEGAYRVGEVVPSLDRSTFARAFARIKRYLADGDSYQVNFTFPLTASFEGDVEAFFADLSGAQQGDVGAFIETADWVVASASPELFFEFQGAEVVMRPMKGTARRGPTLDTDRAAGAALAASAKDRAENVMVVDMVRNDLGRIAEVGTVSTPELFAVRRYPTVWQMTSEVRARSMAPLESVFAALHPSASVTGAPKARALDIIRSLESGPRGIYTGAIGHVPPDGLARFNVAIRTAVIDRRAGKLTFGVGSGIVWDSDADAEYDECLLKGAILTRASEAFSLLETLRWTPNEGCYLVERHLERLARSAEYFDVPLDLEAVSRKLAAVSGNAPGLRVRVLVARDGAVRLETTTLGVNSGPLRVCLATSPIDTRNVSLYHKTTQRSVYERARAAVPDFDEVLLWNERGELTEATAFNVIVDVDGRRVTPPVACGLLAGTYRAELLAQGEIEEQVVLVEELASARGIWLVNSVQGMRPALLEAAPPATP